MTAKQIFEAMLTECKKVNAPSLLLSEYNYYINKAINNYINKRYNIYDINQQTSDDIRVLKSTAVLTPKLQSDAIQNNPSSDLSVIHPIISKLQGATYEVDLPSDYLHLLNCICYFEVTKNWKCYNGGSYAKFAAKRLTADSWSTIINDYFNRPTPERPYYYIHNINKNTTVPTNPVSWNSDGSQNDGTDMVGLYNVTNHGENNSNSEGAYSADDENSNFARTITLGDSNINVSTIERATAQRYGNASNVRMEIRYGSDNSIFKLVAVSVDYIKTPQTIRLTQEQMDLTEDTSQILEYPDYVCQEIINELSYLIMGQSGDPRLQTQVTLNQTIANPAQQQQSQSQTD